MERDKFDRSLKDALSRMQQPMPADMTERFVKRLRKEKLPVQTGSSRRAYLAKWKVVSVVAAAAMLLFIVVPWSLREMTSVDLSQQVSGGERQPAMGEAPAVKSEPPADEPLQKKNILPNVHRQKSNKLLASAKEIPIAAKPRPLETPSENLSVSKMSDTIQLSSPTEVSPENVANYDALAFTPSEIELMERAEKMKVQVDMYNAELMQCILLEQREQERQRIAVEKIVVRNV